MPSQCIPDDFYKKIKPRLYESIGRELRLAFRILDIGCGSCELGGFLKRRYHQQVTGVDISVEKLPTQRRQSRKDGYVRCIRGDASNLGFIENDSIDAVVSMWALHEMKKPEKALREARRKLRLGGKILIVDFPCRSLAKRLWDENYYTASQIKKMLMKVGFQEVQARTVEQKQVIWATGWRIASSPTCIRRK